MRNAVCTLAATAIATFFMPVSASATDIASPPVSELLHEEQLSAQGVEIHVAVTRGPDGSVLGEAEGVDPSTGDQVEVWTDGDILSWSGEVDGEAASGSVFVADMITVDGQPAAFCLTPVTAMVCLVGAALLFGAGGCAHQINCAGPGRHPEHPCADGRCEPPLPPEDNGGGDASEDDDEQTSGGE